MHELSHNPFRDTRDFELFLEHARSGIHFTDHNTLRQLLLKDVSQLQYSRRYHKIQYVINDYMFSIYIYKLYLIITFVFEDA